MTTPCYHANHLQRYKLLNHYRYRESRVIQWQLRAIRPLRRPCILRGNKNNTTDNDAVKRLK